jgi:hypothetical protein
MTQNVQPTSIPVERKLLATNLPDVHTYAPLPNGVHPLDASNDMLRQHGFPMRPDPRIHPATTKLWRYALSRCRRHIIPELRINHGRIHGPRQRRSASVESSSSNWSGKEVFAGAPFTSAWATWTVPLVQPSILQEGSGGITSWSSSIWVGIDGDGSDDVFQAGTEQDVSLVDPEFGSLSWTTYAWYEWYTTQSKNPEVTLTNFPVKPGDSILVSISYLGVNAQGFHQGQASFLNLDDGGYASVFFPKPNDGSVFQQNCAEWIVERPSFVDNSGKQIAGKLADYGIVNISSAYAKGTTGTIGADSGIAVNMTEGTVILSEESDEPNVHCIFGSNTTKSGT